MSFLLQIFPFYISYGEDVCHFSFTQQISMENLKKKEKTLICSPVWKGGSGQLQIRVTSKQNFYKQPQVGTAVLANLGERLKVCWSIRTRNQPLCLLPQKPDLCCLWLFNSETLENSLGSLNPKRNITKSTFDDFLIRQSWCQLTQLLILYSWSRTTPSTETWRVLSFTRFCHIFLDL